MNKLVIKHNELTAEEFILLWQAAHWGPGPSPEQTQLAMEHTLFRVSVFDGDQIVANEILQFINDHGVEGTEIFVELCAMPDKIPFYEKFGFSANEAQRLRLFHRVENGGIQDDQGSKA